jgi:hypothetical protein
MDEQLKGYAEGLQMLLQKYDFETELVEFDNGYVGVTGINSVVSDYEAPVVSLGLKFVGTNVLLCNGINEPSSKKFVAGPSYAFMLRMTEKFYDLDSDDFKNWPFELLHNNLEKVVELVQETVRSTVRDYAVQEGIIFDEDLSILNGGK